MPSSAAIAIAIKVTERLTFIVPHPQSWDQKPCHDTHEAFSAIARHRKFIVPQTPAAHQPSVDYPIPAVHEPDAIFVPGRRLFHTCLRIAVRNDHFRAIKSACFSRILQALGSAWNWM